MPRPKTHDETLRLRLLHRAGELLATEGVRALSLRRLAADVGTSTTAVYSLFGGKSDLVNALYGEGFRRFAARLRAVRRTGEVVADIVGLCLAYREAALEDPHRYSAMFAAAVPGFEPDDDTRKQAMSALEPLWDVVADGISRGVLVDVPADVIAVSCWGCAHGLVSLELNPTVPQGVDFCRTFEPSVRATASGWLR
ncbi:TetR/AcrR family transcriptional regulator [Prauserella oleivorans]|uniref:TetR/AcrR family transcriptional regulator n=1 Tax=Prauserella oleivorans TaxID=1478153 RepID=A0ABW5WCQ4_9PSEU